MLVHEFGIIELEEGKRSYNTYEPQKYNCIGVNDKSIQSMSSKLSIMKTYHHSYEREEFGLAYYGITLISKPSQSYFLDTVLQENQRCKSEDLDELVLLIMDAIRKNKTIIHFGI